MKYRVERFLPKDNCMGLVDFFDDFESAEAVAKATSKARKTYTQVIFEGQRVKDYDCGVKPKKK